MQTKGEPTSTEQQRVEEIAKGLEAILPRHDASLTLTHNEHKSNFETVEQYVNGGWAPNWVSDEERSKAIAANEIWELQWYPDTPVGFYRIAASSLAALLNHLQGQAS